MRSHKLQGWVVFVVVALATVGCSSSSTEPTAPPSADSGTTSQKPPPATAAEAPVLEHFESTIQEKINTGNTPFPQGVRCEPESNTESDIVYACTVYVSKTETATQTGLSCKALDVKVDTSSDPDVTLTASDTTKAGADFGLAISKQALAELVSVSLDASCTTGGAQIRRPYRLKPKTS